MPANALRICECTRLTFDSPLTGAFWATSQPARISSQVKFLLHGYDRPIASRRVHGGCSKSACRLPFLPHTQPAMRHAGPSTDYLRQILSARAQRQPRASTSLDSRLNPKAAIVFRRPRAKPFLQERGDDERRAVNGLTAVAHGFDFSSGLGLAAFTARLSRASSSLCLESCADICSRKALSNTGCG